MGKHAVVEDDTDQAWPLLLTKQQAASWAQVSVSKVQGWLEEEDFPAIRTPRHVRIHRKLFEEWLTRKAAAHA